VIDSRDTVCDLSREISQDLTDIRMFVMGGPTAMTASLPDHQLRLLCFYLWLLRTPATSGKTDTLNKGGTEPCH